MVKMQSLAWKARLSTLGDKKTAFKSWPGVEWEEEQDLSILHVASAWHAQISNNEPGYAE